MSLIRGGRSLVSSIVRSIVRGGVEQRYFTTLNGVDAYYQIESAAPLSDDWTISFDVYVPSTIGTGTKGLIDGDGTVFLIYYADGALRLQLPATSGTRYLTLPVSTDKYLTVTFAKVGSEYSVTSSDGGFNQITVTDGLKENIKYLGNWNSGSFFGGIIANVNIDNKESWALNNGLGETTEQSSTGNNLLTSVNVVDADKELFALAGGNWLGANIFPSSTYTFNGTETSGQIIQSFNVLTVGLTYEATLTVGGDNPGSTTGSAGSTRALIGSASIFALPTPVTDIVTATSVTARWQVNGTPPFSGAVGLEVKRILQAAS